MVVMAATAAMRQTRRDPVAYLPSGARAIEWQAIGTRLDDGDRRSFPWTMSERCGLAPLG